MSNLYIDQGQRATGKKVALCTTVYQNLSPGYVYSLQRSREALTQAGIQSAYILLAGNCHVDDARNNVVQEFLQTDCTDLVFLDADVSWDPGELIKLCKHDLDLVGGIYPFRRDDPASDNMPVLLIPGEMPDGNGLVEVAGLPTGFMKIRRNVLETLSPLANQHFKRGDRRSKVAILFERTFDQGLRLGGDLSFCRKWTNLGGKVYADTTMHLGHSGVMTVWDSLGASLRRQDNQTFKYLVDHIKSGGLDISIFSEARRAVSNPWGALEDVLTLCALMGREAEGPIIESGTGLSTIVLASSTSHPVISLEHDPDWARRTQKIADETGVNVDIRLCEIKNGWYEVPKNIPSEFSLGVNDGPPRSIGSRMGFFDRFGDSQTIICDDADDIGYGDALVHWSKSNGRKIDFIERAALIR